jgi:hypothetical protein
MAPRRAARQPRRASRALWRAARLSGMVSIVMRRNQAIHRRRRNIASCFLLGMLLLRAYVPVGFMPAAGAPFLLQLCPAAGAVPTDMGGDPPMDMSMDPHMDMSVGMAMPAGAIQGSHHHGHFDQCPFGSAPAAGPLSQFLVFEAAALVPTVAPVDFQSAVPSRRLQRAHSPRGPPTLA